MLFQSQVPGLFNKMEMNFYSTANQARKTQTALRLNAYHDAQLERLSEQLSQLFSEPQNMIKVTLNKGLDLSQFPPQVFELEAPGKSGPDCL
jgi:hypothetical protein